MARVHLRAITRANLSECLRLRVADDQRDFVADNAKSLAEAYVDPNFTPLGIYDAAALGHDQPPGPMVGFIMYEVSAGIGFIERLMIGQQHQGKGYGAAAVREVLRRLRLTPGVELIATSHRRENAHAARFFRGLGFVEWDIEWARQHATDLYLRLSEKT